MDVGFVSAKIGFLMENKYICKLTASVADMYNSKKTAL
jgi:hypothetical protein